jgi:hypothetical protein
MVTLFVDNNSTILLMKNPGFHGRNKHINTKYHFIQECVERGSKGIFFAMAGEAPTYNFHIYIPKKDTYSYTTFKAQKRKAKEIK